MDRSNVKQLKGSFQERRRAAALEKQKTARKQATDRARKLALGAAEVEDETQDVQQVRGVSREGPLLPPAAACSCRRFKTGFISLSPLPSQPMNRMWSCSR